MLVVSWRPRWVLTRSLTGLAGCLVTDLSVLACRRDAVVAVVAALCSAFSLAPVPWRDPSAGPQPPRAAPTGRRDLIGACCCRLVAVLSAPPGRCATHRSRPKDGPTTMTYPVPLQGPQVTVGVDTHKDLHVAAARDQLGRRLATIQIPTSAGYAQLLAWAHGLGEVQAWGVEGTGSYGAGLTRFLAAHAQQVLEVNRPDRATRRRRGKSDPVDADAAARAVQAGEATGIPKAADGTVEMLRALRAARQTAVKARTQAINALKALLVTAPAELRESLTGLPTRRLVRTTAALTPGALTTPTAATMVALCSLAQRYQHLDTEISQLTEQLDTLTTRHAPKLRARLGIGPDSAAALLIAAGDNPAPADQRRRIRGAVRCLPGPGLLRQDHPASAQPRRRPPSQRRPAPDRARPTALAPAHPRLRRPPHRPGQDQQGDHALPQALRRPRGLRPPLRVPQPAVTEPGCRLILYRSISHSTGHS